MNFRFPLKDVSISSAETLADLTALTEIEPGVALNQHQFQFSEENVGVFQALNASEIRIQAKPESRKNDLELILNGSVFGAILHQRNILSFHAGSFEFLKHGILICGDSEVGKSTTTLNFCLSGANFLSDETTPVLFEDGTAFIWGISDRLKIWDDALDSLGLPKEKLLKISEEDEKYYYELQATGAKVPLSLIFVLEFSGHAELESAFLSGKEKLVVLRNQVYRKEYLSAMPETEKSFFKQLAFISQHIPVVRISRPEHIHPNDLKIYLSEFIAKL